MAAQRELGCDARGFSLHERRAGALRHRECCGGSCIDIDLALEGKEGKLCRGSQRHGDDQSPHHGCTGLHRGRKLRLNSVSGTAFLPTLSNVMTVRFVASSPAKTSTENGTSFPIASR